MSISFFRKLISVFSIALYLAFIPKTHAQENPIEVKVLSYNIHYGIGMDYKKDLNRIADIVNKLDPEDVPFSLSREKENNK